MLSHPIRQVSPLFCKRGKGSALRARRGGCARPGHRAVVSFSVAYDFLATSDINKDRIQDVLFLYKNSDGGSNVSLACAEEGNFVSIQSVSGRSWENFWKRSPGPSFQQD